LQGEGNESGADSSAVGCGFRMGTSYFFILFPNKIKG
jgi:hypothetical protein